MLIHRNNFFDCFLPLLPLNQFKYFVFSDANIFPEYILPAMVSAYPDFIPWFKGIAFSHSHLQTYMTIMSIHVAYLKHPPIYLQLNDCILWWIWYQQKVSLSLHSEGWLFTARPDWTTCIYGHSFAGNTCTFKCIFMKGIFLYFYQFHWNLH